MGENISRIHQRPGEGLLRRLTGRQPGSSNEFDHLHSTNTDNISSVVFRHRPPAPRIVEREEPDPHAPIPLRPLDPEPA
jgi:hypothetical protein